MLSIVDTFDSQSEEILKPYCIASPVAEFPETVIITFKPKFIDILKTLFKVEEISYLQAGMTIPIYKFEYKKHSLGIYMTVIGAAATTALMEEVLVKGAKKIFIFGSCGVLDKELVAGHIIVPTSAYRDEGTSYHYMPAGDYVDIPSSKRLGEIFDELNIHMCLGRRGPQMLFTGKQEIMLRYVKKRGASQSKWNAPP